MKHKHSGDGGRKPLGKQPMQVHEPRRSTNEVEATPTNAMQELSAQTIRLRDGARRAIVSASRSFNASLDTVFYDVGALTEEEKSEMLARESTPEGSVLVVHPRDAKRPIEPMTPKDFAEQQRGGAGLGVDTLVVAGVGSSALGTAALARNVADYLQRPVAGIVSGFGVADVLSEAWGGIMFGMRNALRANLARLFDFYELKDHVRDDRTHGEMKKTFESAGTNQSLYGSPDSAALLYLLLELGPRIKLVVGHSKGNLSIESALEGLLASNETGQLVLAELRIVTLGAVTWFPREFSNLHQFIGTHDYLGLLNSSLLLPFEWMPLRRHSLNTAVPGHLPVHEALQSAGAQ